MKNHTIIQLKAIAKERGIKGYYKLRKAELIHALELTRLVEQTSNISDIRFYNHHLGDHQISLQKASKR